MPLRKTTFFFSVIFISFIIVPLISFLLSFLSFHCIQPNVQSFTSLPNIDKDKMIYRYKVDIKRKSFIYANISVPETPFNLNAYCTFLEVNDKTHYVTMKYKSPVYMMIDTFLFFPFIKLNLYCQEQKIKSEILRIEPGLHDIVVKMLNDWKVKSLSIDVIENCHYFKIFIYEHEMLCKCVMYIIFFVLFYFVIQYLAVVTYKKIKVTVNKGKDEIMEASCGSKKNKSTVNYFF